MNYENAIAGFGVGLLVGMTGVGGGSLMSPLLILLFGVAPDTAVGTDMWFAAITKIVGGYIHQRKGTPDWLVVRRLYWGSLPAALLTLIWLRQRHLSGSHSPALLTKVLGFTLILSSISALFRTSLYDLGKKEDSPMLRSMQPTLTVLAGALLGFLVTFTSIGAGALGAAMLLYLYPRRLSPRTVVGTDIVHAIPLTILGGAGHFLLGDVNAELLGNLLIGSIPGIIVGSIVASYVPTKIIGPAIAVALAAVGLKMVL